MNQSELMDITLRTEVEILESWTDKQQVCLLSVMCITYKHVDFIEAAIKSFLFQKTVFPIEIWIHDDASTDGTREIIEDYKRKYPSIIKTILQTENQYSKGKRATKILRDKCKGKYIAVCEGDDFWCDPFKLQKQVDYLEAHPEIVISGHDAFIIAEDGNRLKDSKLPNVHKRDYSATELQHGQATILTMSWVYRNIDIDFAPERLMVKNGDAFFISILGQFGGSHYHDDIELAAYRVHDGGIWSKIPDDIKIDDTINTQFWMYRYYKRCGMSALEKTYHRKAFFTFSKQTSIAFLVKCLFLRMISFDWIEIVMTKCIGSKQVHKFKAILKK